MICRKNTPIERAVLVGLNADCFQGGDRLGGQFGGAGGSAGDGRWPLHRQDPSKPPHSGRPHLDRRRQGREIRQLIQATEAGMAIFDNPLSPSQIRVLEELLRSHGPGPKRLDFGHFCPAGQDRRRPAAGGAGSVPKYLLPRLSGMGISLSRQGGGIDARPRRDPAGDGPPPHSRPDCQAGGGAGSGPPGPGPCSAANGSKIPVRWWPWWGTPTQESPPC